MNRHLRTANQISYVTFVRQVSAVQKIARIMPLPPGLSLYRGLGGTVSLPACFYKTDEHLCRGFAEWGFMSTTADRQALTRLALLNLDLLGVLTGL